MLEILPESRDKIIWVRASGKLTDQDYREVFIPRLEAVLKEHGKARLLFQVDQDFAGWSVGALWDDLKLDWQHKNDFERVVVVAAPRWVEVVTNLFSHWMQGEVRTMPAEQLGAARAWIYGDKDLMPPGFESKSGEVKITD
jgi:hypothetical protein